MRLQGVVIYLPVLFASGIALFPVVYLVFGSLWSSNPGSPGQLTTQNFAGVAGDPTLWTVLFNTVAYAAGAAVLAVTLAVLLATAIHRTDAPLRRLVSYSLLLVLALPWFVEDMSWNYLLGPRIGLYNILLAKISGIFQPGVSALGSTFFNVNTIWGMVWVMGLSLTPLAYLVISPSLSLQDPNLEEASLISGANLRTTFLKIDLPLALPSVLSAGLLCLVIAIEAFDAAEIIGAPGKVYVLASTIYGLTYQTPPDFGMASAYALIMVAITMGAIILYSNSVKASRRYVTVSGRSGRPRVFSLGRLRWVVGAGFVVYLVVYPISVLATLVFASIQNSVWSPLAPSPTLANFSNLLVYPLVGQGIANSLFVGLTAGAAAVGLGGWLAYVSSRRRNAFGRAAELVASLPLAFPTIVLGVGLLWALVFSPLPLYGTVWALTLAYTVRYVPIVARFLSGPLLQLSGEMEEASRICGASFSRTVRSVVIPILKPALLVSAVYVLIVSIKDLGAAVMLATGGSYLFSAALFDIYRDEPFTALAGGVLFVAVLSLILVVVAFGFRINLFSVAETETLSEKTSLTPAS